MTDERKPGDDLPVAGRKPEQTPFTGTPEADPDEPTVITPPAADRAAEQPRPDPGGATVRLTKPEPDLDGPTRRLRIPAADAPPTVELSPERVTAATAPGGETPAADVPKTGVPDKKEEPADEPEEKHGKPEMAPWRRLSSAGALICVLLALFGFTLVVQLRSNDGDQGLATARQEDLVRILSDLEARDSRLQSEISALETSQRQLTSGVAGRQAALAEADKRADELGLLAGTLPGRGPGLRIVLGGVKASAVLNAVQELRGAGGEVMQLSGAGGTAVRVVASSYFVDAEGGGLIVDGTGLAGPFVLEVIGSPQTMQTALQIPGGVVASVNSGGGSVTLEQRTMVEVTALRKATTLQYARPVS